MMHAKSSVEVWVKFPAKSSTWFGLQSIDTSNLTFNYHCGRDHKADTVPVGRRAPLDSASTTTRWKKKANGLIPSRHDIHRCLDLLQRIIRKVINGV